MSNEGEGCLPDAGACAEVKNALLACFASVENVGDGPKVVGTNELTKASVLNFESLEVGYEFS